MLFWSKTFKIANIFNAFFQIIDLMYIFFFLFWNSQNTFDVTM